MARRWTRMTLAAGAALAGLMASAAPARASENGASLYLLGTGGPGAAELPPLQGVFLSNTYYHYDGKISASKEFLLGGNVVAGAKANLNANFLAGVWVPTTDLAGGTLVVGAIMPAGETLVKVNALISGPQGNSFNFEARDNAFIFGDPVLTGSWGWKRGNSSVAISTLLNIPVGTYREDRIANLSFHRWANDWSLAGTWHDPKAGWDISGKTGVTFNGKNDHTQYKTGTEFHAEGSVERLFSPEISFGAQIYYFQQLTGDSGAGAKLGSFKGQVTGVGLTGAYNTKLMGKIPATFRLHAFDEFNAKNRMKGHAVFLDFSMPLHVVLPPGAPAT